MSDHGGRSAGTVEAATQRAVEEGLAEISRFVQSEAFRAVYSEMWSLAQEARAQFVADVLLNPRELLARGVQVPDKLVIQRSAFRDNRPTLFCITRHLEPGLLWAKVTITFDNPAGPPAVLYEDLKRRALQH